MTTSRFRVSAAAIHSGLFILALLAIIALVTGLCLVSYHQFRQEAEASAKNLAEIISDDVEESLSRAERDLLSFAVFVKSADLSATASPQRRRDIEQLMQAQLVRFPQVVNYRVFTAQGDTL